ncbi:MAG TPA: glutathione S-transferase family protein [Myxococcota bacterium]|nr:glutathione S-transferase family protein [Myxococcota bacterium]
MELSPQNRDRLVLYDNFGSPCARRVRITLLEKSLVWDTQIIDLSRLEHRRPDYLLINPNGFVPALAHGSRVVFESNVITEYLDDLFPESLLYPVDPWHLAQVKMWQAAEGAMAKDYRTLMYQRLMGPVVRLTRTLPEALAAARRYTQSPPDLAWEERVWRLEVLSPEEEAQYENRLYRWLDRVERALEGQEYLVGGRFSQAEISLFPRIEMYPFVGLSIEQSRYPNVRRWLARLSPRSSFAKTHSREYEGISRLARTPVLPWIRRVMRKPEAEWTWLQRVGTKVLGTTLRAVLKEKPVPAGTPADRRPIHVPSDGPMPPRNPPARCFVGSASGPAREAPMTLYGAALSPCTQRIVLVLAEKELKARWVEIDIARMEHKAGSFLALNPNGEVPVLLHGERVIYENLLIAEYLDSRFPDRDQELLPRDAFGAAQVRMWLALEAGTHKEFRPLWYLHLVRPELKRRGFDRASLAASLPPDVDPAHRQWILDTLDGQPRFDTSPELARRLIESKLERLEERLRRGAFLVGDQISYADFAWFTRAAQLEVIGVETGPDRYPGLSRWREAIAARPSIRAASAEGGLWASAARVELPRGV